MQRRQQCIAAIQTALLRVLVGGQTLGARFNEPWHEFTKPFQKALVEGSHSAMEGFSTECILIVAARKASLPPFFT